MTKKIFSVLAMLLGLAIALPVLAENTTGAPTTDASKIVCVGKAVAGRESALSSAVSVHAQAVGSAYSARASALKSAYEKTTAAEVKKEVRVAWKSFGNSVKDAKKSWQKSRNAAWTAFRTAVRACRAPAVVLDSANSGSELSGQ